MPASKVDRGVVHLTRGCPRCELSQHAEPGRARTPRHRSRRDSDPFTRAHEWGTEFRMRIADLVSQLLGADLPVRIDCYDGSSVGPAGAGTRIVLRSPDALASTPHRTRRARLRPGLRERRARRRGRHLRRAAAARPPSRREARRADLARDGPAGRARAGCAGRRSRPKKRGCTAAATPRRATRPRSRITTTCRTTSIASCSALR